MADPRGCGVRSAPRQAPRNVAPSSPPLAARAPSPGRLACRGTRGQVLRTQCQQRICPATIRKRSNATPSTWAKPLPRSPSQQCRHSPLTVQELANATPRTHRSCLSRRSKRAAVGERPRVRATPVRARRHATPASSVNTRFRAALPSSHERPTRSHRSTSGARIVTQRTNAQPCASARPNQAPLRTQNSELRTPQWPNSPSISSGQASLLPA